MKLITSILLAIVMSIPCISIASEQRMLSELHKVTLSRFGAMNEDDNENERFKYYNSFTDIIGDCDDFASAIYYELWKRGIEPEIVAYDNIKEEYRHAIVCAEGYCFDNNYDDIIPRWVIDKQVEQEQILIVAQGSLDVHQMYDIAIHEIIARISTDTA